jgi:TatD DNase family protein
MIDTHSHTNKFYYPDIDNILEKSKKSGVEKIIVPATSLEDSLTNPQFIHPMLYYAIGSHPELSKQIITREQLESVYTENIIAIGECGLDYYRDNNKENQEKNFRVQIEYALEKNLPLIVHTREALEDTLTILSDYYKKGDTNKGVIHSADGDISILEKIEDRGFYLSFNGISTFKNADKIRNIIKNTDLSKILIETDSPFLTPEPIRNEKINNSSNIIYVLENIEKIKNTQAKEKIYQNSIALFKLNNEKYI